MQKRIPLWLLYCIYAAAFVALLRSCPTAHAAARIDKMVADARAKHGGVGLVAWIVNGAGRLCAIGSSGERIKNSGQPLVVTGDSRHHVGSVSKGMTAVLLATLIKDGSIKGGWDTKLKTLLPMATGTAYADLPLKKLLAHMSGIPRDDPNWGMLTYPLTQTDYYQNVYPNNIRKQRRICAENALNAAYVHPPGTKVEYSNWAYVVAGHIVERLTGKTWERNLVERIFTPLGIVLGKDPTTFTGAPNNEVDPWGHWSDFQLPCDPSKQICDMPRAAGPCDKFSGPVAAMAAYFAWHIRCHKGKDTRILSKKLCRDLHRPVNEVGWALGWGCSFSNRKTGDVTCSQFGSNLLNEYFVVFRTGEEIAYVAYSNGAMRDKDEEMMEEVMKTAITEAPRKCKSRIPSSYYRKKTRRVLPAKKCAMRLKVKKKRCLCGRGHRFKGIACIRTKALAKQCNPPKNAKKRRQYFANVLRIYLELCK